MPEITKNKIIYDERDWLAGLHPQNGNRAIPQKFGKYSSYQLSFNPFINLGYAQSGYLNSDITKNNIITSRIVSKAEDTIDGSGDEIFYALEDNGIIHQINQYNSALDGVSFPHEITDAVRAFDICKYRVGNIDYYFYNHRSSAAPHTINIGRYDSKSNTFDDDFMSTVPTGANLMFASLIFNPLIVGHDDIMYVGGRNYVGSYDGPNNTFVQQRLKLPEKLNVVAFVKYPPRTLAIFVQGGGIDPDGDCRVYFWDYLSDDPYDMKKIDDFEILSAFEYKGTIACITRGRDLMHKIMVFNGSIFQEIARFSSNYDGKTIIGPSHRGVFVNNNEIWFNVADSRNGYICCYGNNLGVENKLNVVAKNNVYVSDSVIFTPGIITIGKDNKVLFSSGSLFTDVHSASSTQYLDTTKYSEDSAWYSDLVDIGDERIRITGITVYFADEFTGGRAITMELRDRYTSYNIKGLLQLTTVTSTNRIYRIKPFNYTGDTLIPPLDGVGIKLSWSSGVGSSVTPIINKIVLDYEPVKMN